MSKIGILGGSFNPIHNGHIYIAREVKKRLLLDKIIFIPTGYAPHKDNSDFAPKPDRFNMVKLSVGNEFEVSDIEIKKDGPCYAVDTMKELKNLYRDDVLYYIIGADSLRDFMKWREPLRLFSMLNIVVVDREDTDIDNIAGEYREKYGANIFVCHIKPVDISSTEIRRKCRECEKLSEYVPNIVEEYIKKHKLYTEEKQQWI